MSIQSRLQESKGLTIVFVGHDHIRDYVDRANDRGEQVVDDVEEAKASFLQTRAQSGESG